MTADPDSDLKRQLDEARAELDELRHRQARIHLALSAPGLGYFDWSQLTDEVDASDNFRAFVGAPPGLALTGKWVLENGVHPDDLASVTRELEAAMASAGDGAYSFEHRTLTGGRERCFRSTGRVLFEGEGAARRPVRVVGTILDITEARRAADALRDGEESQGFLLRLSDALRPIDDPIAVQDLTVRMLGEAMAVDRSYYAEFNWPRDTLTIHREHTRTDAASAVGEHPISAFQGLLQFSHKGEPLVCDDIALHPIFKSEIAAYRARRTDAFILVPLVKQGVMVACMGVTMERPRAWSANEIDLVREVADRTWAAVEMARAEEALHDSRRLQSAMLEVTPVGLALIGADGRVITSNPEWERFIPTNTIPSRDKERGSRWRAVDKDGRTVAARDYPAALALRGQRCLPGIEFLYTDDQDVEVWTNVAAVPLFGAAGEVVGAASIIMDIDAAKRSEAALRESDERFRQFADASSGALWIRDAETLKMEYVSPVITDLYGVEPGAFFDGVEAWAATVVPDDRQIALRHIEEARRGRSVVHEFRIRRGDDQSFRWIRNTDFPLRDAEGRIQRIGGIAEDVTEAKLAVEHQGVLLSELQHRVRNIMAMIRSVTTRTADGAATVGEYAALMTGRLMALSRTQTLLTRAVNAGVEIGALIREELAAQAQHEDQYRLTGPEVVISPKAAEVLALAVHELTTNALKYGALANADGTVAVDWRVVHDGPLLLRLDWVETIRPADLAPPSRRGFGSELIEQRVPYELGGRGRLEVQPDGARAFIEFPLTEGASILGTDAPVRTRVFGGSIDMKGEPGLAGLTVLALEDDYYLAQDAAGALRGAGADVAGPFPTEAAALRAIAEKRPDAAVVDINLGAGPSYAVPRALRAAGVPFVFLTGYDDSAIPEEFGHVPRLQKPAELREVVRAVARLAAADRP